MIPQFLFLFTFFFNATATTEIYTLSLHDALPISGVGKTTLAKIIANTLERPFYTLSAVSSGVKDVREVIEKAKKQRSEEHTSELQSRPHLVCRLLLEKKKKKEQ